MGLKLTSLRDFFFNSTTTAKLLSVPHRPGGKSGRRGCHPVHCAGSSHCRTQGSREPSAGTGQSLRPGRRTCREEEWARRWDGGRRGGERREAGGARREGRAWPRPGRRWLRTLSGSARGPGPGGGACAHGPPPCPPATAAPGPAPGPELITRDARRNPPCSADCCRRWSPGKAAPAFPLLSLGRPLPGSLRGPAEEAEGTARPQPRLRFGAGREGRGRTPRLLLLERRATGFLALWGRGDGTRARVRVGGGEGSLGSRSGYLSPLRAEVLSGSSSFSIQFSLCREPHKWRTSGTRRVSAGRGVRFPILFARTLTAVSVSTRTLGPSRAPRGLGHLGPSHSPASVSRSRWARGLQAARPGGPRVWLGSFLCRCGVGAVGRPPLPSEGALRSLAGGVGRLARPRCPVSGWHRTVGGAAPQEMSAVRVAAPFGPLGGCALQGRKV
ncbi:uncharacterized protein [Ovis canadensis]|uniref:uncharacterized protein n=1 Tax=Ovis canadensis TaxID=37174 RepID=UPI0037505F44